MFFSIRGGKSSMPYGIVFKINKTNMNIIIVLERSSGLAKPPEEETI
jgi:hypothetical protein